MDRRFIRAEVPLCDLPSWATDDSWSVTNYIMGVLKDKGFPVLGTVNMQFDFSQGILQTWVDFKTDNRVFVWRFQ